MSEYRCVNHSDRLAHPEGICSNPKGPHFCTECYFEEWNKGARWADEHWADEPGLFYKDYQ